MSSTLDPHKKVSGSTTMWVAFVVGLVVIVVAITMIFFRNGKHLAESRNSERRAALLQIGEALNGYTHDRGSSFVSGLPQSPTCIGTGYSRFGNGGVEIDPRRASDKAGLVLLWHMKEGQGTELEDAGPYKNNGSLVIGPHGSQGTPQDAWMKAKEYAVRSGEDSLSLDGSDDMILLQKPLIGLKTGDSPHSITAWVYVRSFPSSMSTRAWILLLGEEGQGAHHWLIDNSGRTYLGVWGALQSSPPIFIGRWTHIAVTYDGSVMSTYVNGALFAKDGTSFNLKGGSLSVGQQHFNERYFDGLIDELAIYNRALTAQEIQAHLPKCIDTMALLVPEYLKTIPMDPGIQFDRGDTGYTVQYLERSPQPIKLTAPMAELGERIQWPP
jgi:hypothetical protein